MWFTHIRGHKRCQGKIVNLKENFFCSYAVAIEKNHEKIIWCGILKKIFSKKDSALFFD
jgi:hypothetical protein